MILLDTNVLSELARDMPDPAVLRWAAATPLFRFCTTAITEAEMRLGLAIMAQGRRHADLTAAVERVFRRLIGSEGPSLRKRTVRNENTGKTLAISSGKG